MILTTADECRELLREVAVSTLDGEEAEQLLAAVVGADRAPPPDAGTAMTALKRLKVRTEQRRLAAAALADAGRARPAVSSFVQRLGALPARVEIDGVGSSVVVSDDTRRAAPGWADELASQRGPVEVYEAVRSAMADLRGAAMRLELGISRLG